MTALIPAASFSHVDTFEPSIRSICGRFTVAPSDRSGALKGRLSLERLGGAEMAFVGLQADRVIRQKQDIRADPGNHYFLVFQDRGHALMQQGASRCLLREGDMFLVDSTTPSRFDYQGRYSEQISLHLPRSSMQSRFGSRIRGGIDIKREDALSIAMRSVLKRMLDRDAENNDHLAEAFFGILGAFLIDFDDGRRVSIGDSDSLIASALQEIDLRYKDSDFGPQDLADRLGVSLRVLQRAFKDIDETPRQKILATRLAKAHTALSNQSHGSGPRTVSTIAFAQGFNDLSYFYREFGKRYGYAPGKVQSRKSNVDPVHPGLVSSGA
ncbi:helix-turn-helix domain-containing protein [Notoacmeibacter marinus]|nr:helix-turn-helix domain-containing protein [Notoacmeibacter marinus]